MSASFTQAFWTRRLNVVFSVICFVVFMLALLISTRDSWSQTASTPLPSGIQLGRDMTKLPPEVQRMRQAILQAATSGQIEELRVPIEMNELPPVFAKDKVKDAISHFKHISGDGEGREILAILYNLLTTGYAIKDPGTKNEMIVWPYHAAVQLNEITPSQEVELYRFVSPERFKSMKAKRQYDYYSVSISREGVWHSFTQEGTAPR